MKKLLIALFTVSLLIAAGCATSSTVSEDVTVEGGITDENSTKIEKTEPEKTEVTEIVNVPYLVKDTSYFSDGYVNSYTVYTFNEDMTPAREDLFDSFDEIIESVVYEKLSGTEVKRSAYNSRGELQSWKKLVTDGSGMLVRSEVYNADDVLQTSSEYSYDAEGNKLSWKVYDNDNVVLTETRYVYKNGNNVKIEIYDTAMKLKEYFENSYEGGLLVRSSHMDENGKTLSAVEYSYVDGVLVTESHLRANGSKSGTLQYSNDTSGSPVKIEFYDGNGKLKDWNERDYEYVSEEVTVLK